MDDTFLHWNALFPGSDPAGSRPDGLTRRVQSGLRR
jgi:hypothetical protein